MRHRAVLPLVLQRLQLWTEWGDLSGTLNGVVPQHAALISGVAQRGEPRAGGVEQTELWQRSVVDVQHESDQRRDQKAGAREERDAQGPPAREQDKARWHEERERRENPAG